MLNEEQMREFCGKFGGPDGPADPRLIKSACCRRAFLRGAFLGAGSISDPKKGYHMEFVCSGKDKAEQLKSVIQGFDIEAKIVVRKKYYVVYLKEGAGIVDLLNVMEAHVALMDLENLRIIKEMRNSINRRVNCETANISKTVNAAARQIEEIEYLRDHYGLKKLPDSLREMAELRLEYPDAPLKELGEYLDPPVGKSGVNHRLRKLSELAEKLRS
jgi:DNA-binding protein WhiA